MELASRILPVLFLFWSLKEIWVCQRYSFNLAREILRSKRFWRLIVLLTRSDKLIFVRGVILTWQKKYCDQGNFEDLSFYWRESISWFCQRCNFNVTFVGKEYYSVSQGRTAMCFIIGAMNCDTCDLNKILGEFVTPLKTSYLLLCWGELIN